MAGYYQYPIEHQDEFLGTISFEAMIEPPVETTMFGSGWGAGYSGIEVDVEQEFKGLPRAPITPGVNGVVGDGKVTLFLPMAGIDISDGASYDNVNLGLIGGTAAGLVGGGSSIVGAAATAVQGGIESFVSGILNNQGGDFARLAAVRAADMVSGISPEMNNAVKSVARVVPNPNARTLFRGVAMRGFNFEFTLIPNSVREAQEIKNIVRFFRTQLYPEDIGGTATTQGVFGLKFPNKFEIKIRYNNKELGVKYLPSYLTSFQAQYNGQGGAMHKDGNWNSVRIQLAFTETRTLVKQDIQAGY